MKKSNVLKTCLLGAAVIASVTSLAQAGSAYEACEDRSNKLRVIYDLYEYPVTFRSNKEKMAAPTKTAELVVSGAYGESRNTSEKKWPGFYDWSVQMVVDGLQQNLTPNAFKAYAMHKCMVRYSK